MEFEAILKLLIPAFEKNDINYALIGGFAMGATGMARSTMDLDFLVDKNDMPAVAKIVSGLGYTRSYSSENVSQYISDAKIFGEIDFLHALRPVSLEMLKNAVVHELFGGKIKIKILKPEDLIGLKAQAMANDPERTARDSADIEDIVKSAASALSWNTIENYFMMFGMADRFTTLKTKYAEKK